MRRRDFIGATAAGLVATAAGANARRQIHEPDATAMRPLAPAGDAEPTARPAPGEMDAAAFATARRFAPTPSGEIAYVEQGEGPAALLLHGFPLNGFQYRGVMARLAPHRRCIAPDFLGLGHTRVAPGQSMAPAAQATMLVELMDRLGVDSADVVANDSGDAVAQLLAEHHPGRVRSLLLTNGDSEPECPPPGLQPVIGLAKEGQFVARWLVPWLADFDLARSAEGLGGITYTHPQRLEDATLRTYLMPLVADPARTNAFAVALEANSLAGIAAAQRQCRVPVRLVWGTGDRTFSRAGAEHLHRAYPTSRGIRWVEGANLFFPEEFPDLIAREALALWHGLPLSGAAA